MASDDDPFDEVLNIEEKAYQEGYAEGYKDGAEAGRIEGRSVGMKKGFEKFLEAGRLQGKAIVWANRIPDFQKKLEALGDSHPESSQQKASQQESSQEASSSSQDEKKFEFEIKDLPPLKSNPRLEKNILMLYGMVEPGTLSTSNDDESVNDFDSRMKGAEARVKMIEKALGEGTRGSADRFKSAQSAQKNENIEDIGNMPRRTGGSTGQG
ncbi:DUF1715-domain-containing protein [Hypoxylon sp. EC38]|nr:DUF1715-domain-containing protein [Hypoxylon sp. EC38]